MGRESATKDKWRDSNGTDVVSCKRKLLISLLVYNPFKLVFTLVPLKVHTYVRKESHHVLIEKSKVQLGSAWGCKMKCCVGLFFPLFTAKILLTRLFYSYYLTIICYYWHKAKWNWGLTQQNYFWRIQSAIICQVLLMYSNFNKNFDINKNASGFQFGAVISQNSWPDAFFL
jgi:hypothetical protein